MHRGIARQDKAGTQLGERAARIFAANDRINQLLFEHEDRRLTTVTLGQV